MIDVALEGALDFDFDALAAGAVLREVAFLDEEDFDAGEDLIPDCNLVDLALDFVLGTSSATDLLISDMKVY